MNNRSIQKLYIIAAISVGTGLGCQHIGPQSIVADRLAYNRAILTSWEEQTLLNIVRVRYHDLVSFVDVGSVTQQHTLMGSISSTLGAALPLSNIASGSLSPSLTGSRSTSDSPTITYTPLTGSDFTRNLNAPLKPSDIFNLVESGYRADVFLNLTLYSINGIPNTDPKVDPDLAIKRDPLFIELTQAIACAYQHGDLAFYGQKGSDSDADKVFMVIEDKDSPACCPQSREGYTGAKNPVGFIRETLRLRAAETKFEIVAGSHPRNENEIAVRTRSAIAAMRWLSNYVDVPEAHLEAKLAVSKQLLDGQSDRPFDVKSAVKKPKPRDVFAAVQYNGYWFSIRQDATNSKWALIYLRTLLAYADTGPKPPPPVLAIPTR